MKGYFDKSEEENLQSQRRRFRKDIKYHQESLLYHGGEFFKATNEVEKIDLELQRRKLQEQEDEEEN